MNTVLSIANKGMAHVTGLKCVTKTQHPPLAQTYARITSFTRIRMDKMAVATLIAIESLYICKT